jgi:4-amino-4-deoxy-L-arabinose transferase-like glycosyltransferase
VVVNEAGFWTARRAAALACALALALAAAEFAVIGKLELSFDEAYYTLWSRRLAFGYLDHPPMVAVWIRLSTLIFGASEFGVRALNVVAFALSPAMIGFSAARLFDSPRVGAFAALVWLAMPLTAAAFLATPDTPLTIFSIVVLMGLIEVWRGRAWGWAVIGVALGLALQSKFSALFLVGGIALAVIITPSLRRWSYSPAPYAAALIAAAIFAPFVAWNATHGWETFIKQFGRIPAHKLELRHVPEFLVSAIGVANPFFVVAGVGWLIARKERPPVSREVEARRILLAYIAPTAIYFPIHALHDHVQVNWLALVFPALAMLVGAAAANGPNWVRRAAGGGVVFGCLTIALLAVHVATMWPSHGAAELLARWIGGWRTLTAEVDSRARSEGAGFILVDGYASTSLLTVYGDGAVPVLQAQDRERWQFLPAPDMQVFDRPGLAFTGGNREFESELARHFRHVEPLGRLARKWQGDDVGEFQLFRVSDAIPPVFE